LNTIDRTSYSNTPSQDYSGY